MVEEARQTPGYSVRFVEHETNRCTGLFNDGEPCNCGWADV